MGPLPLILVNSIYGPDGNQSLCKSSKFAMPKMTSLEYSFSIYALRRLILLIALLLQVIITKFKVLARSSKFILV